MTSITSSLPATLSVPSSALRTWTARVAFGLATAFLAFDAIIKVLQLGPAKEGTAQLGFPPESMLWIGLIEVVCLALYLVPRTALVGAVLWTGYLGGAVATHVRLGNPLATHTLFPIYVAVLLWLPLYLRDGRARALLARR